MSRMKWYNPISTISSDKHNYFRQIIFLVPLVIVLCAVNFAFTYFSISLYHLADYIGESAPLIRALILSLGIGAIFNLVSSIFVSWLIFWSSHQQLKSMGENWFIKLINLSIFSLMMFIYISEVTNGRGHSNVLAVPILPAMQFGFIAPIYILIRHLLSTDIAKRAINTAVSAATETAPKIKQKAEEAAQWIKEEGK